MSSCNACNMDLIDVSGLCPANSIGFITPVPTATIPVVGNIYWQQMYIPETLSIPPQKPDVEEVNSVNVSVNIIRQKVVVTPTSTIPNLEGKTLTGRKLIVEGQLCQKIVYTACDEEQSVHSAHYYVPFSSYIVVPQTITFPSGEVKDSLYVNYSLNTCIEDLYIKNLTPRVLVKNVTLLIQAVPTSSC